MITHEVKVKVGAKNYYVICEEGNRKNVVRIRVIDGFGWRPIDQSGKLGRQILDQFHKLP